MQQMQAGRQDSTKKETEKKDKRLKVKRANHRPEKNVACILGCSLDDYAFV